jgi:hypothetical protein
MLEIVVEEKNGIKRGGRGKEKGCSKVVFLILFSKKNQEMQTVATIKP